MQSFVDFLVNNYLWFLVISLILVFALIGYLVDTNEKKDDSVLDQNTLEDNNLTEKVEGLGDTNNKMS